MGKIEEILNPLLNIRNENPYIPHKGFCLVCGFPFSQEERKKEIQAAKAALLKHLLGELGQIKIPTDKAIEASPCPKYAQPYAQGKFDVVMEVTEMLKKELQ